MLHALANPDCEIATVGAIKHQAQRCYRYVQNFLQANPDFISHVTNSLMSRTDFDNKAVIEVLIATVTGVNSPHPQKLFIDEIELINWFIIQQAFNMVKSKGDIIGQTVLGSTQKFIGGPMERLLNDALLTDRVGVYEWCIWEIMEKPPVERWGEFRDIFKEDLPANFTQCDGYFSWDDFIDIYTRADKEIIDTEWFCKRPESAGLVYPRFSDENNCIKDYEINKNNIYVFEDYGYGMDNPNVLLFCNVDLKKQEIIVFDEVYLRLKTDEQIFAELDEKLATFDVINKQYKGHIGDPHGLPETASRYNAGYPIMHAVKNDEIEEASKLYLVRNGIVAVRKFVDMGWIKFTPNCTQFREEMMSYRKVKNPDGTYKDEAVKKYDHGPDALRYGIIRLFPTMSFATFDVVRQRANVGDFAPNYMPTITGGMLQKVF